MPTTPNGTAYTITTTTIAGQGRMRRAIADTFASTPARPAFVYAHGANGGVGSFTGSANWAPLLNWLIDRGWVIIEGEGGLPDSSGSTWNHWGNLVNRAAYSAYIDNAGVDVAYFVMAGSSMGGLISQWLAHRSPYADRCRGYIGFGAVQTMFVGNDSEVVSGIPVPSERTTGRYFQPSIMAAYGVSAYGDLAAAAADHAPERFDPSVWQGRNILEVYGTNDTTVPWYPRGGDALRTRWAGRPAMDVLSIGEGAGHDIASGVGVDWAAVTSFIETATADPEHLPRRISVDEMTIRYGSSEYRFSPGP